MKKLYLLICLFLLTGCHANYNLTINNDSINEEIVIEVDKTITDNNQEEMLSNLLNLETYAFGTQPYRKIIENDNRKITLNYQYSNEEFSQANILSSCYENFIFLNKENYYYLTLTGKFYCNLDDGIKVKIKTPYMVMDTNATKIKNNTYIWNIDENNSDIVMKIYKKENNSKSKIGIFKIILIIIVITTAIYVLLKNKRNRIDEYN